MQRRSNYQRNLAFVFVVTLIVVMVAALAACGGDDDIGFVEASNRVDWISVSSPGGFTGPCYAYFTESSNGHRDYFDIVCADD